MRNGIICQVCTSLCSVRDIVLSGWRACDSWGLEDEDWDDCETRWQKESLEIVRVWMRVSAAVWETEKLVSGRKDESGVEKEGVRFLSEDWKRKSDQMCIIGVIILLYLFRRK